MWCALISSGFCHWRRWGSMCYYLRTVNCALLLSWQRLRTVAQHPRRHETKGRSAKSKVKTSLWSCLQTNESNDAWKTTFTPSLQSWFTLQWFLLIPTHNQSWLSLRRGRGLLGEMVSSDDVWWSILCFFLSPPMQTPHRGIESKFMIELSSPELVRVEEFCYERA